MNSHFKLLPRFSHVTKALKAPGESGLLCLLRDLDGAVLVTLGTPLVFRSMCNSSMCIAMQLECAQGAQMLPQTQVQVNSF